jgi:hypothetical protein
VQGILITTWIGLIALAGFVLRAALSGLQNSEFRRQRTKPGTFSVVQDYIDTGRHANEVASLSRRSLEAAVGKRQLRIKERTLASHEFHAVAECPACTSLDLHDFDSVFATTVHRKCKSCNYQWMQS